ncbi:hypothetical protein SAMN05518672_104129 [Chitinophaga sp. CF118]|uniref:hypothetical protein n=1 Tax=Chitinophaga sp. CF118 TaxID=1884367 RepID=UPI0008F39447|nr:hypothetical protein [Chitinophaga sp. CF118]SFE00981.1 hypothetical protein SAMN05518672_104129 [Chitinophaga sp. CF118]
MIQDLRRVFGTETADCLTETNDTKIEIFDCYDCAAAQQKSYIKAREEQPVHFTLENPTAATLAFAALDNCLLRSDNESRCDFFIGNSRKLYFVEIKQVKSNQRSAARANAIKQLDSSISLLKDKIDLQNTSLIAVVCLKAKQVYPLQSAKRAADIVAFKETHNADLMEGQSHTF